MYVVYIWKWSSAHALGASVVWHHSLLLMNSFNKTEPAVFSCRLCFLRAFPFISLIIEKGRHSNINRADRLWIYCHMNAIENEYLFLLVCPFFNNLRKQYFKSYFCHWPTKQKLIPLMTSTNKITLLNVSEYIYYAFLLRSSNTL